MLTWLSANLSHPPHFSCLICRCHFHCPVSHPAEKAGQAHLRMQRRLRRLFRRLPLRTVNTPTKEQAHGTSRAPVFIIADLFTGWIPAPQKDQILTIFSVFHASVVA